MYAHRASVGCWHSTVLCHIPCSLLLLLCGFWGRRISGEGSFQTCQLKKSLPCSDLEGFTILFLLLFPVWLLHKVFSLIPGTWSMVALWAYTEIMLELLPSLDCGGVSLHHLAPHSEEGADELYSCCHGLPRCQSLRSGTHGIQA